jgi:hypothetical protein
MNSSHSQTRSCRNLVTTCLLSCILTSCTVVGPGAVGSGRLAYNEAIIETDNQQMLLAIVRNRYGERNNLLAVSSVTANVRVTTNTGIEAGLGSSENFVGNLVPFRAGVIYEENPTISYTPVAGEKYAHQLMSPVPVALLAQMASIRTDPALAYNALVSSINGIYNPDFLYPSSEPDPRFSRFVTIMTELTRAHRLHWIQDPQQGGRVSIVIDRHSPDYAAEASELLHLLGLPAPEKGSSRIVLPVSLALDGRETGGVAIITRSLFDLLEILSGAVEVPEQDQDDGVATSYPPPGLMGKDLRVRHTETEPGHASVAVKYRDGWFYIDERDQATKWFFRLLGTLYSVTIAESTARDSTAPVLTVPVSH